MKPAMKQEDRSTAPESKERPGLTLAEKVNSQFFQTDTPRRVIEPELLVNEIRGIVGDNESLSNDTRFRKSDQLARLLGALRFDDNNRLSERVTQTFDEALEACFLLSDVYKFALEIYRLEVAGQITGGNSAYELLQEALHKAQGSSAQ